MHRSSSNPVVRRRALLTVAAGLSISACGVDADPDDEFRVQWQAMHGHFELVYDGSVASQATGALEVLMRDENGWPQWVGESADYYLRGTCGLTFISPRYAITAAHCVPDIYIQDPAIHTLPVRTYDITAVNPWDFLLSSNVDGKFPHYEPLVPAEELSGYEVRTYECSVTSRCSFGAFNCSSAPGADVAMLFCPDRGFDEEWLPVAGSDPQSGPVEMYWFHELLEMPTQHPGSGDPEALDRFDHYTVYDRTKLEQNYHYLSGRANALLPLRSIPFADGTERKRVGGGWTDMFGCHGTSGSGVLQRDGQGDLELLGPVEYGGWGETRLCTDPDELQPGARNVSYESNAAVRELAGQYEQWLFYDRIKVEVEPPKA